MPRPPHTSRTASGLSDRVYSQLAERAKARGGHVLSLHVGDTYLEPTPRARAEMQRTADRPLLHSYAPVQGEPELIDEIVNYLDYRSGRQISRACIQVTAGATTGLSVVCQALLDAGDEVILPSPFWPLIRGIINSRGARAVEVPLFTQLRDRDFDLEKTLESAITEKTVALYVNAVHNPSGVVLSAAELDIFERVAVKHDLWIFSDEAYEEIFFGEKPAAFWARPKIRERTIAAHTLSKGRGMAGARVGFIHGPEHAMAAIRAVNTFQSYGAARPMQYAAIEALRHGSAWANNARALYREAAARSAEVMNVPMPEGSTFLFVDVSPFLRDGETTAMPFLERCVNEGLLVTPGTASGTHFERHIRLCYTCVPPADLTEALARMKRAMNASS